MLHRHVDGPYEKWCDRHHADPANMREFLMQEPGAYDGADTRLCADCDEVVEGWQFHPDCCPHDIVEEDDGRDGAGGRLRHFCESCGDEVLAEPNEDGGIDWVLA